jgi:hypothetical protein
MGFSREPMLGIPQANASIGLSHGFFTQTNELMRLRRTLMSLKVFKVSKKVSYPVWYRSPSAAYAASGFDMKRPGYRPEDEKTKTMRSV